MGKATFLDKHVSDKVIERGLSMNSYQTLTWENLQTNYGPTMISRDLIFHVRPAGQKIRKNLPKAH